MAIIVDDKLVPQTSTIAPHIIRDLLERKLYLAPMRSQLIRRDHWSEEKVVAIEPRYRRFLYMSVTSNRVIVPTTDIDRFWHWHVLDTVKYAADCERLFSMYLHHYPYLGMGDDENVRLHARLYDESRALYEETYVESYEWAVAPSAASRRAAACG